MEQKKGEMMPSADSSTRGSLFSQFVGGGWCPRPCACEIEWIGKHSENEKMTSPAGFCWSDPISEESAKWVKGNWTPTRWAIFPHSHTRLIAQTTIVLRCCPKLASQTKNNARWECCRWSGRTDPCFVIVGVKWQEQLRSLLRKRQEVNNEEARRHYIDETPGKPEKEINGGISRQDGEIEIWPWVEITR